MLHGYFVRPGVIDTDYTGQICAMVSTPTRPVSIPAKSRIVQLVPFKSFVPKTDSKLQENGSFGFTGEPEVYSTQVVSDRRPNVVCTLKMPQANPSHIKVSGMIDTGADVMIISANTWLQPWSTIAVGSVVAGLGGTTQSYLSSKPMLVKNLEEQPAMIHPYVTAVPLTYGEEMSCQHGGFGWEQCFNRGHCAEGHKASHTCLKMTHWRTCVCGSMAP